ncbi:MAG: peptidoglycan-binding protein, partial [Candidatus Omnitrophota bacterium]|nr:peptidoglycan-binding protein [Candidatus Omnitrophota bacterium]
MIHKLLLKLSVAAIAVSFTSQTVLADRDSDQKRKGFFESLFGQPSKKKKRKTIQPWWKEDAGTTSLYGRNSYGDEDYSDPEPIPGKGMGNISYVPPKLVALSDPSLSSSTAFDTQSRAILAELSAEKPVVRVAKEVRQPILDLDRNTAFKPLWLTGNAPSQRALAVLAFAEKVNEDGLEPLAYLPTGLSSFSNVTEQLSTDPQDLAKFDIAMTAVTLKLAREISGGQFEPNSLSRYNDITPERVDAGQALKVLAWTPFPDAYLKGLMPNHESYGLMKAELAKLRASRLKPAFEKIAEGNSVKLGKSDPRISLVRDRMQDMGFLDSGATYVEADLENILDADLSAALKKFQKSVKLRQTGILDAATVKNL